MKLHEFLMFCWENIAIFAILLRYINNLSVQFYYAFEILHLGIGEILHQCGIYQHDAQP